MDTVRLDREVGLDCVMCDVTSYLDGSSGNFIHINNRASKVHKLREYCSISRSNAFSNDKNVNQKHVPPFWRARDGHM